VPLVDEWINYTEGTPRLGELHFYGLAQHGRIGMYLPDVPRDTVPITLAQYPVYTRELRKRRYELKDHLGNERVIVTDLKLEGSSGAGLAPWLPDVTAYNNYYSFGMLQPNRSWGSDGYRYGYNGKEMDNEEKGVGNSLDYGARSFDPRIARWGAADPLEHKFPQWSTYSFAANSPISATDNDGRLVIFINGQHTGSGGSRSYWRKLVAGGKAIYAWDKLAMKELNDAHARYYDGAIGGFDRTIKSFRGNTNLEYEVRMKEGKEQALADAASIFSKLGEGETIKIVAHSMGVAYARGFVEGLKEYVEAYNELYPDRKIDINKVLEAEYDIASYQGRYLPVSGIVMNTYQMFHDDDELQDSWKKALLAPLEHAYHSTSLVPNVPRIEVEETGGHSIMSFSPFPLKASTHSRPGSSTVEQNLENNENTLIQKDKK
jgi:RHS repeat-associated protein